jgi:hypothetical protein
VDPASGNALRNVAGIHKRDGKFNGYPVDSGTESTDGISLPDLTLVIQFFYAAMTMPEIDIADVVAARRE